MFIKSILMSSLFATFTSSAMASGFNFKLDCKYPDSKIVNGLQLAVTPSGIADWKLFNNDHELKTKYTLISQYSDYGSIQLGWEHETFDDLSISLQVYDNGSGNWSGHIQFGPQQDFEISCKESSSK